MPQDDDRRQALAKLPLAHAVALRLRDAGAAQELIADALAIEPEGVASLLEIAEAKLRRAQATSRDPPPKTHTEQQPPPTSHAF